MEQKNKFEEFINNNLIKRILVASKMCHKETTEEDCIKLFNELDEKYRFFKLFSELKRDFPDKLPLAINYIEKSVIESENNPQALFSIGIINTTLRSYLIEEIKEDIVGSEKVKNLNPYKFSDFIAKEEKKIYYVKNMFGSGTINMIFSPPKQMKSFISYFLGLCIASGNEFLNIKTKKVNVGYFDWENPLSDIQNRVRGICKGMQFNMKKLDNFYFFFKEHVLMRAEKYDSYVYESLRDELIEFIKINDLKVLFFDTFRRIGNFDENDSKAINTIKTELFDPLIKETNICIIFLHHTSKEGINYRGSVDIEGIVDTSWVVNKKVREDEIILTMKSTAKRNNEIDVLTSSVYIENESIEDEDGDFIEKIESVKFIRTEDIENETEDNYSEYRNYFINNLKIGELYKNKELSLMLSDKFGIKSSKTHNSILSWCSYRASPKILLKTGNGKNTRYQINPELVETFEIIDVEGKDKLKIIEDYLHVLFKEVDQVSLSSIIEDNEKGWAGKFSKSSISIIINKWNEKGWLNKSRKDKLYITELYKEENR